MVDPGVARKTCHLSPLATAQKLPVPLVLHGVGSAPGPAPMVKSCGLRFKGLSPKALPCSPHRAPALGLKLSGVAFHLSCSASRVCLCPQAEVRLWLRSFWAAALLRGPMSGGKGMGSGGRQTEVKP